ncbi:MAG: aminomethyl-transferring glycine dehydrogenase subunit GcvPA [Planctomycetes bacterium]|nr:aminomethyl-transferring glycine dehydrogenase subunit GcvPA [Planctomycetota bacterium]
MDFTQLTADDVQGMLSAAGAESVESFFSGIDPAHRVDGLLDIPLGVSEPELLAALGALAAQNQDCERQVCFLGAGSYDHFIPTIVDHLASLGSFLTGYTPYQAEASQGSLQAFFEFQTMICQLTGMEVANASLYDYATAAAEAVLMARTITRRSKVVISAAVHPDTVAVVSTYTRQLELESVCASLADGVTDADALASQIDENTAAVVVQSPNFFGAVEDLEQLADCAHRAGALLIVGTDPISCALLRPPGACDADIVVGDGQPLGIPMQYGGPVLGFLSCRTDYLRKVPGRIVGMGEDRDGRRSFCLTLQTREQHIKRQRATSNVCTNQGLMALRATFYLAAMGKQGLSHVASLCFDKAHYAAECIAELDGYKLRFDQPFFKEFTVQTTREVPTVLEHCRAQGILAGVSMGRWFDTLTDCFTVSVTERRSRQQIDELVEALRTA